MIQIFEKMSPREAKTLLAARRPNGADDMDPDLSEALTISREDSVIGVWARSERLFDQQVASKLRQVMPPLDLRERILAGRRNITAPVAAPRAIPKDTASPLTPTGSPVSGLPRPWVRWGLVAGALVTVATATFTYLEIQDRARAATVAAERSSDAFRQFVVGYMAKDWDQSYDLPTRDYSRVNGWLSTQPGAVELVIPTGLARNPTEGCKVLDWNDRTVTLICFRLAGLETLVHLLAINQDQLSDVPGELARFVRENGWNTATWSRKGVTYVAMSKADLDTLKRLF